MSFNPDKPKKGARKTCKDCQAFVMGEEPPEGICVLNPPQVVIQPLPDGSDHEILSIFPNVDGERSFCFKLIPKGQNGKLRQE